jgi:hypothetical protein
MAQNLVPHPDGVSKGIFGLKKNEESGYGEKLPLFNTVKMVKLSL